MEIYCDSDDTSQTRRKVSFGNARHRFTSTGTRTSSSRLAATRTEGRKPLTPHNKKQKFETQSCALFQKKPSQLHKVTKQTISYGKENTQASTITGVKESCTDKDIKTSSARVSSLRRDLRNTMISPTSTKKNAVNRSSRSMRNPLAETERVRNVRQPDDTTPRKGGNVVGVGKSYNVETKKTSNLLYSRRQHLQNAAASPAASTKPRANRSSSSMKLQSGITSVIHQTGRRRNGKSTSMSSCNLDDSLLASPLASRSSTFALHQEPSKGKTGDATVLKDKNFAKHDTVPVALDLEHPSGKQFETTGNGVKMDLSNLFRNAESQSSRNRIDLHGQANAKGGIQKNNIELNETDMKDELPSSRTLKEKFPSSLESRPVARGPKTPRSNGSTKAMWDGVSHHSSSSPVDMKKLENGNDEWAQKQCAAFTNWLNYTLQPIEDEDQEKHSQKLQDDNNRLTQVDPTGLRSLILHQRMAQVRVKALELFDCEEMVLVKNALHDEVYGGRLSLRVDRDMYADLNLRGKIISLLLSYSIQWLRLGLETIFAEQISPEHTNHSTLKKGLKPKIESQTVPQSRMKLAVKKFIVRRVLSDPETLTKYTKGKCKVPSGNFEKQFRAETRKLSLYRLLVLIVFLDRAKMANVTDRVPHLFAKDASVKSSKNVLVALCRDFLSGEGNIIKHLSRIGVTVSYAQSHIDEIDLSISNIAVDLRDGVRLARVVEIVKGDSPKTLLKKLRLPAVSRLQKLHNAGLVLDSLRESGVPNISDIYAYHIVDGHRTMALKLLWSIVAFFELESLVDADLIEEEIENIRRTGKYRRQLLRGVSEISCVENQVKTSTGGSLSKDKERLVTLLLRWCQTVCCCFGVSVANFTTSFADGKVLCLLLHYYHPRLLKRNDLLPTSRDRGSQNPHDADSHQITLRQERQNSTLANNKISELGGMPDMLSVTDSENVPEEKCVLLCLAFLCSRLMQSSKEISATIAIQKFYRQYRKKIELQNKQVAAAKIFKGWKENKARYYEAQRRRFNGSVRVIESFYLNYKDGLRALQRARLEKERRGHSATVIQKYVKGFLAVKAVKPLRLQVIAARLIQMNWRAFGAQRNYVAVMERSRSALTIQRCWRGHRSYVCFVVKKRCALSIQTCFRGCLVRNQLKQRRTAAIDIQRRWRGFLAQMYYFIDRLDVLTVQSIYRRKVAIRETRGRTRAVLVLQKAFRRFLAVRVADIRRTGRAKSVLSVVKCQSMVRMYLAKRRVHFMAAQERASTVVQKYWRAWSSSNEYAQKRRCTIYVQACHRAGVVRRALRTLGFHASVVQNSWRGYKARKQYLFQQRNIVVMQSLVRRRACRSLVEQKKNAVATLQALVRRWMLKKKINKKMAETSMVLRSGAAMTCQRCWRGFKARAEFAHRRSEQNRFIAATIYCQSLVRRRLARQSIQTMQARVVVANIIQSSVRTHICKSKYRLTKDSAIFLQSCFRKYSARCRLRVMSSCAATIQRCWRTFSVASHFRKERAAVLFCQSLVRRQLCLAKAETKKASVVRIQCMARRWFAAKIVFALRIQRDDENRRHGLRRRATATIIQARYRGYLVRRNLGVARANATTIQRVWRGFYSKMQYHMDLIDIILVQSAARRRVARVEFEKRKHATTLLQRVTKCWLALHKEQAVSIQRRIACVIIQSSVRSMRARTLLNRHRYARKIQKTFRCYIKHVDFLIAKLSVEAIQSHVRRLLAVRKYQKTRRGIVLLQSLTRRNSQRKDLSRRRKLVQGVVIVQSLFRGHMARASCSSLLKRMSIRIHRANLQARSQPSRCLGARTAVAFRVLEMSTQEDQVTDALKVLEMTTSISEECCIMLSKLNGTGTLYKFIRSLNRSRPHLQQLEISLLILLNVAEHPAPLQTIATETLVDVVIDVLQMFRDKYELFCKAASLLEFLVLCKTELKSTCRSKGNRKRLEGIIELVKRNLSIDYKRKHRRDGDDERQKRRGWKNGKKILQRMVA